MSINRIQEYRATMLRQSEDYKRTRPLLDNLLSNILYVSEKKGFLPTPYEIFQDNCVDFYERWLDTSEISSILGDLKRDVQYPTEKHKAMSKMLAFMGLVESLGITMADMLLILVIANGKEVHTRGSYIKHVSSFSELKDVDWDYKSRFLKDEKFEIISKVLNLELRNTIAHLKFSIDDDGVIRGRGKNIISIDENISNFWDAIDVLTLLFEDLGFLKWLETTNRSKAINTSLQQFCL